MYDIISLFESCTHWIQCNSRRKISNIVYFLFLSRQWFKPIFGRLRKKLLEDQWKKVLSLNVIMKWIYFSNPFIVHNEERFWWTMCFFSKYYLLYVQEARNLTHWLIEFFSWTTLFFNSVLTYPESRNSIILKIYNKRVQKD